MLYSMSLYGYVHVHALLCMCLYMLYSMCLYEYVYVHTLLCMCLKMLYSICLYGYVHVHVEARDRRPPSFLTLFLETRSFTELGVH